MKSSNIVEVIGQLGEIIINNKNTISYLEYENKELKKKIEKIEQYIEYYTEQSITNEDYDNAIK